MPNPPNYRRRWFQFGLSTLIVIMTLVGVSLGWLARERKFVRDRRAFDVAARACRGGYAFSVADSTAANWPQPISPAERRPAGRRRCPSGGAGSATSRMGW